MNASKFSFRFKITVSLIFVVASISFVTFYIFNNSLGKILHRDKEENILSVLEVFKDQFYYTFKVRDGRVIYSLLDRAKKNKKVTNTYLINADGKVVYPAKYNSLIIDSLSQEGFSGFSKDIELKSFEVGRKHFTRAFIQLQNSANCYACHNPSKKTLGYIVIDFSMEETEESIIFARKFSIFFTIIMVVVIVGLIIFMHYRFVRQSLSNFKSSINIINQGNLDERIIIPKSKELGLLAKDFNEMLDNFQKTQKELQLYHQKELHSKRKLATIGEMAARLAHEIRNPLTGIANAIEILVNQMPEDQNKHVLVEIRRQAGRVNNAISNMLRYSRNTDLVMENSDINDSINALVYFIKNQVHHKKIEFKKDLQPDIPLLLFDHEQIENVLLNLGLNAMQAIHNKGTITFKTALEKENGNVIITVEDTGVGIPAKNLKTIFDPFFTTRTEGTGLGLAISHEVIEKHKGKIWAESEEGKGSKFYISLPLNLKINPY